METRTLRRTLLLYLRTKLRTTTRVLRRRCQSAGGGAALLVALALVGGAGVAGDKHGRFLGLALFAGVLEVGLRLVAVALAGGAGVAGDKHGRFLRLSADFYSLVLGLIDSAQVINLSRIWWSVGTPVISVAVAADVTFYRPGWPVNNVGVTRKRSMRP